MIPKIIYYIWISDKSLPDEFKRYVDNWYKIMPDYDFRFIDINNCPKNYWVNECIDKKKFVLASNYARLECVYNTGGFYLDVDFEILKRFDNFIKDDLFFCLEDENTINDAIFGAKKNHIFLLECMEYAKKTSIDDIKAPVKSGPLMITELMEKRGWKKGIKEGIFDNIKLYSKEYFYPYNWNEKFTQECITNNTHAIHKWAGTWLK